MPRKNRKDKIDESRIGTHHIIARAVRGAFLFGFGAKSAEDYSERREWIGARLKFLASIFLIDILGYSVMSNHYHAIMRNRPDLTRNLSDYQIAVRIWRLRHETDESYTSKRRSVSRRSRKGKLEEHWVQREVDAWLSPIDERDERESPPAAGSSKKKKKNQEAGTNGVGLDEAMAAPNPSRASDRGCLPMSTVDYFALLDYMGRRYKPGKRGKIPSELPPILERLGIPSPEKWLELFDEFQDDLRRKFPRGTNRPEDLEQIKESPHSDKPLDPRSFL